MEEGLLYGTKECGVSYFRPRWNWKLWLVIGWVLLIWWAVALAVGLIVLIGFISAIRGL